MRLLRVVAWGLCAAPLALGANPVRPHAAALKPNKPIEGRPPRIGREVQQATPEEWNAVEGWMKINCPNRLDFFTRMPDPPQKEQARQLIVEKYRQIMQTKFQPLQRAMVQQAQAQDQIFGAQVRLRQIRRDKDGPQKEQALSQLRLAVGKLIDAEVDEKTARVGHLQNEIEHLRKNRTQVVDKWMTAMTRGDGPTSESASVPDGERSSSGDPDAVGKP